MASPTPTHPSSSKVQPIPFKRPYPKTPPQLPRQKPMRILALGLSRTGTMSLQQALNTLGYRTYHMMECTLNNAANDHHALWNRAIDAKYQGVGPKWSGQDLDEMLSHYDAVSDVPCVLFVDELLEAHPDAKVILTTRPVKEWKRSVLGSYYAILEPWPWRVMARLDQKNLGPTDKLYTSCLAAWTGGNWRDRGELENGYERHNDHVRSLVPTEQLLEFNVKDGWGPLCAFLGHEVPEEPYPIINVGIQVADIHNKFILRIFAVQWLLRVAGRAALVGAPVALAYWCSGGFA